MADRIVSDHIGIQQRALVLLAVADRVTSEGWDDEVAAQLRQAARELIAIAGTADAVEDEHANRIAGAAITAIS